jgi:ABC-type bacteriocin/lantibiotic exporter with double-glycine peptidase domain
MFLQVLGLGSVAVVLGRSALLVVGSIAASRQLHERLLAKMLRLPMSFYDAQPTGAASLNAGLVAALSTCELPSSPFKC